MSAMSVQRPQRMQRIVKNWKECPIDRKGVFFGGVETKLGKGTHRIVREIGRRGSLVCSWFWREPGEAEATEKRDRTRQWLATSACYVCKEGMCKTYGAGWLRGRRTEDIGLGQTVRSEI